MKHCLIRSRLGHGRRMTGRNRSGTHSSSRRCTSITSSSFEISRGAVACCADYQFWVDIVIPFTYWDTHLRRENVTAILIQVKNDESYQVKVDRLLFDVMDPYRAKFFDENEKDPLPIIQIVFALASTEACITVIAGQRERVQPSRKGAYKAVQGRVPGKGIHVI